MKLQSHTIVPANLYVRRRADAQLAQIISDLGRPGYVLVARQMGKTNLLLNAKRDAQKDDHFVYLDISNIFPDERGFFRNIIDVAVDLLSNGEDLASVFNQSRKDTVLLPHKEHERELREILKAIPGKMIICLDEIDALTKTNYSDQIFSFIRSIYFSGRANIPEFARLTYVLSGVAEPSDLIKNKAISPFNIGEKIYLNDFSESEVAKFLELAQISLPSEVVSAVYGWTNGHPRMTWDLIAEILKSESSDLVENVDVAVRHLYFGSVDIPPVDHIKSLVEVNRDVRDSLVAMHYGKTDAVTDSIRTKLYLDGITKFNPNDRKLEFKNKVLELALSEDFLLGLDRNKPTFESALRSLHLKMYEDALSGFLVFSKANPDDSRVVQARYWAGVSCYFLNRYEEAINFLDASNSKLPITSVVSGYFFHGMSYLKIGENQAATILLTQAVAGKTNSDFPEYYFEAKVSLATAILGQNLSPSDPHLKRAVDLSESIFSEESIIRETFKDDAVFNNLLFRSNLNAAKCASMNLERAEAMKFLEFARKYADSAGLLHLFMVEHSFASNALQASTALQKAAKALLDIRVFESGVLSIFPSPLADAMSLMEKLVKTDKSIIIPDLIDHLLSHLSGTGDIFEFINNLVVDLINIGRGSVSTKVLEVALRSREARGNIKNRRELLALAIITHESEADKYGAQFFASYEGDLPNVLNSDIRFLGSICLASINHSNPSMADRAVQLVDSVSEDGAALAIVQSMKLIKTYLKLVYAFRFKPDALVATAAQAGAFLRSLSTVKSFSLAYYPVDYQKVMQMDIFRKLRAMAPSTPVRRAVKYGRNDVVSVDYDGEVKTGKYKSFVEDIRLGFCKVIGEG